MRHAWHDDEDDEARLCNCVVSGVLHVQPVCFEEIHLLGLLFIVCCIGTAMQHT